MIYLNNNMKPPYLLFGRPPALAIGPEIVIIFPEDVCIKSKPLKVQLRTPKILKQIQTRGDFYTLSGSLNQIKQLLPLIKF